MRRSFFLLSLALMLFYPPAVVTADTFPRPIAQNNIRFIQPLPLLFTQNDYHVMLYFEGHPRYEAIEAMIKERTGKEPFIRLILTKHDQTQIDYYNDKTIADSITARKGKRETHYAPMQYLRAPAEGKAHILISLESAAKENIIFDLYAAGEPSGKYGGLIDPGGHSEKSALPVMFRDKSTLADPKSKISFNGVEYKIPVKVKVPIFFTGMKGYYSENFNIGVIDTETGLANLKTVKVPAKLAVGEKWIYETNTGNIFYEIIEIRNNELVVKNNSETIFCEIADNVLRIKKISVSSPTGAKESFSLTFNPSLLLIAENSGSYTKESDFAISITEHNNLVTGKMHIIAEGKSKARILLKPDNPQWATKRAFIVSIEEKDGTYSLQYGIGINFRQ